MRARAAAHLKGNIWLWIAGSALAGAAAGALGLSTPAAFLFMAAGLLVIMADNHVDPVALFTEDALHGDASEVAGSPGGGATTA